MKNFLNIFIILIFCIANCGAVYEIDAARNASLHNNNGVNYLNEKNYYGAIKEFEMAILLNPETQASAIYYNNLGKTYLTIGYPNLAEQSFTKALKLNAANFEFYQNLVKSYKEQNKLQAKMKKSMSDKSNYSRIISGLILLETGQKEAGINMLDEFCFDEPEMILSKGVKTYIQSLAPNEFNF